MELKHFFDLRVKDNVLLLNTKCYVDQSLVLKEAGAGAEVTVSGVFADIVRVARL